MLKYDLIIIGFGKAGKTIASKMASQGKKVALIEQDENMYGGTCINIACIPTKIMLESSKNNTNLLDIIKNKNIITKKLNLKNYNLVKDNGVHIITGKASFKSNKVISINLGDHQENIEANNIIINTGATPIKPNIVGINNTKNVFNSTEIQNINFKPKKLAIIGGGHIGLEFANIYKNIGSEVTIFDAIDTFLPNIDKEVSSLAKSYLMEDGITLLQGVNIENIKNVDDKVSILANSKEYTFDAVLYATGRKPNIEELKLENTEIKLNDKGNIIINEFCETTVKGIFAVGDVNGGPQFTYISLDDSRIVYNYLNGDKSYSLKERKFFPTSSFLNPPLSQIGFTEEQAKKQNLPYKTKSILVANIPRAHIDGKLRGILKVVVNTETKQILGATFLSENAHELINLVTIAMDNKIPYTYFQKQIFTHPTMAEIFNDLFNI